MGSFHYIQGFVKIRLEYMNDSQIFSKYSPSSAEKQLLKLDCVILPDLKERRFWCIYIKNNKVLKYIAGAYLSRYYVYECVSNEERFCEK